MADHDFGWALHKMQEGKTVRRSSWVRGIAFSQAHAPDSPGFTLHQGDKRYWRGGMNADELLARDWELVNA